MVVLGLNETFLYKHYLLVDFLACGVSNRNAKVVGGNITKIHEFPWLAGLSYEGKFYCGASLVSRRHLITAAHCVEG